MNAVACSNLSRTLGDREVVRDVSFAVPAGAAFGLLGPNGAGKTTIVRLLTGLLTPNAGSVTLFGEPLTATSADRLRERIGVQTDTNLYETLTVGDNLTVWADLFGVPKEQQAQRIDEVLETFALRDRIDSRVGTLSKGMRQKLAVARAILHEPDLLFLDEPTAGLDPEASEDLIAYLRALINHSQTTVVICTHQLFGLERLCTHVGLLEQGGLKRSGAVDTLLAETWPIVRVRIDVGEESGRAADLLSDAVLNVRPVDGALEVELASAEATAGVVRALVEADIPVRAVVPHVPTIQDLYFATIAPERSR